MDVQPKKILQHRQHSDTNTSAEVQLVNICAGGEVVSQVDAIQLIPRQRLTVVD